MKPAICCVLLLAAGLCAQSTAKLDSDLTALGNPGASRNAVAQQITDDILALAEKDALPSRQTVLDFAVELTKALAGKALTVEKTKAVTSAIQEVLLSSGAASFRFHASIDHLRDALIALNATAAQAKVAAGRLLILGQEVRGPEDIPFRELLRLK
jgi:hypothetical protein